MFSKMKIKMTGHPRFLISANLCRSAELLQNFVETCRFETNDLLRNIENRDVKRIINKLKLERRLMSNDETFFCSNLYKSVEITDLYGAKR